MKRGLFLVATFTLSSALYAQSALTHGQAREVFAAYNPALLERASQDNTLNQLIDDLLRQYIAQNPADTLENRYTLIALARNFENSLALNYALSQYEQALIYSRQGGNVQAAARQHAQNELNTIYPRIWAVSVQVKEDLLHAYKQRLRHAQTTAEKTQLNTTMQTLQADLKNLRTDVGPQLLFLTQQSLQQAEQATRFPVKTSSQKPRAG